MSSVRSRLILAAFASIASTVTAGAQEVSGPDLHVESLGTGPAVLVLHGFAARWRPEQWQALIDSLGPTHRIIGVDVRGFGRSAHPHDPEAYGEELAHDVVRVLDAVGVERAAVVGYSMGGIIALKAAALHPDRISSVILIGQGWASGDELSAMAAGGRAMALTDTMSLPPAQRRGFRENDVSAVAAMVETYPALAVDSIELGAIPVPIAIIVGSEDPRLERGKALLVVRPDAQMFVLPGRSHGSVIADPAYAGVVRHLLTGSRRPSESP